MSLPGATIEQLAKLNDPVQKEKRQWIRECERLQEVVQRQRETIAEQELTIATMRRRIEALELEKDPKS